MRQSHHDTRAAAVAIARRHPSTIQLHELLDDREAKAGAARIARTRPIHAIEPLEDPGKIRGWDAGTAIAHDNLDRATVTSCRDGDLTVFGTVVDRVFQEITQHVVQ